MFKRVAIIGVMALSTSLVGCLSHETAQLHTQGQGEVVLKADQYSIQIMFSVEAATIEQAREAVQTSQAPFLTWVKASQLNVSSIDESIQPMYQYSPNEPRRIAGYTAQHSYHVKDLSLQKYADTLTELVKFNPQSLRQGEVDVSDKTRDSAMTQAYEMAYAVNEEKRDTLMELSGLCTASVSQIKEYSQSHGGPRVMMMEAKSAPVANELKVTVQLEVEWQALKC